MFKQISFERKPEKNLQLFSTQHQLEGGEIAKKLGASKDSDYARVVGAFKRNSNAARRAYTFVSDAKNVRSPINLFFWKLNQLNH